MKNHAFLVCLFIGLFFSHHAFCGVRNRLCNGDQLTNIEQIKKRNLWAVKCGFVPNYIANYLINQNMYPSFANSSDREVFVAPVDDSLPCIDINELKMDGLCFGMINL